MKKGILLLSAILALGSLSSSAQKRTATMTDEEMYLDAMVAVLFWALCPHPPKKEQPP